MKIRSIQNNEDDEPKEAATFYLRRYTSGCFENEDCRGIAKGHGENMKATSLLLALGSILTVAAVRTDGKIGRKASLDARRLRRPARGGEDEQQHRAQRMGASDHGALVQKSRDSTRERAKAVKVISRDGDEPMGDSTTRENGHSMSVRTKTVKVKPTSDESTEESLNPKPRDSGDSVIVGAKTVKVLSSGDQSDLQTDAVVEASESQSLSRSPKTISSEISKLLQESWDKSRVGLKGSGTKSGKASGEILEDGSPLEEDVDFPTYFPSYFPTSSPKAKSSKREKYYGSEKSSKSSKAIVDPVAPKSGKGKRPGPGGDPEGKSKAKKRPGKSGKDDKSAKSSKQVKSSKKAKRTLSPVVRGTEIPTLSP